MHSVMNDIYVSYITLLSLGKKVNALTKNEAKL